MTASPASLRRYVRANLPEQVRRVPLEPGAQAHVDHGYLGTWHNPGTGQRKKVWAFVMSLPASRHMFVYPVLAMDQRAWAAGHVAAFEFFGGVPARLVPADPRACKPTLCDPKLNRLYVELAAHFGTLVDPARSVRLSRGSHVDRQLPYVRDSFWRAADFRSLDEMRAAAVEWRREVAGRRPHRQFGGATPIGVYTSVEANAFGALPTEPFTMSTWTTVTVGADGFAKVGRTLYSLPWRHAGASLDVRQTDNEVQFFQQDQLVKTHARRPRGRQADPADHPLCVPLHARSSEPISRTSDDPLWAVARGCARSGVRHWLRPRYVIRPALRWRPCRSRGAMGAGRFREGI